MTRIAVFISGRGSNFMALHENIKKGIIKDAEISVVFSNKEDAKGLDYAKKENIEVIVIPSKDYNNRQEYDKKIVEALKPYNINLICLAGYMRIVTHELIKAYENKIINIHPALLPSFKGLHAQKQALEYGVKYSGCTVHFVDDGMDNGAIILQKIVEVYDDDTEDTLSERILKQEHIAYSEAVSLLTSGKVVINGRKVSIKG